MPPGGPRDFADSAPAPRASAAGPLMQGLQVQVASTAPAIEAPRALAMPGAAPRNTPAPRPADPSRSGAARDALPPRDPAGQVPEGMARAPLQPEATATRPAPGAMRPWAAQAAIVTVVAPKPRPRDETQMVPAAGMRPSPPAITEADLSAAKTAREVPLPQVASHGTPARPGTATPAAPPEGQWRPGVAAPPGPRPIAADRFFPPAERVETPWQPLRPASDSPAPAAPEAQVARAAAQPAALPLAPGSAAPPTPVVPPDAITADAPLAERGEPGAQVAAPVAGEAAASAPQISRAAPPPPQAQAVLGQILPQLRFLGDGAVDLALSPVELGNLRLSMLADGDRMIVHVVADRPETLDLIRRHADQLGEALRDSGFADVQYSFSQGQRGRAASHRQADSVEAAPASAAMPPPAPPAADDRLDIRL